jgi:arylformamidase
MHEEKFEYFDLSPEITEELKIWPGDQNFKRTISVDYKTGGNYLLSSIQTTLHLGAHADAPNHYHPEGKGIESRELAYYFGPCQVISVVLPRNQRIQIKDLKDTSIQAKRVLFHTGSFPDPAKWNSDFNALSVELVHYLAGKGVILIGIDTPSVDVFSAKVLEAHHAIYENDLAILEGIKLDSVPAGLYHLAALPLRIKNADASPVRAILYKER